MKIPNNSILQKDYIRILHGIKLLQDLNVIHIQHFKIGV